MANLNDFSSRGTPVDGSVTPAKNDFSSRGVPVQIIDSRAKVPTIGSAARGAVNAATLGFGDSIGADNAAIGLVGALGARAYDKLTGNGLFDDQTLNQTTAEGQQLAAEQGKNAFNDHPVAYIAGGLPVGAANLAGLSEQAPAIFAGASPEADLAKRVVGNAKAGAAFGALQGALSTKGDAIDRAGGAAVGGAIGAVAAPVAGEVGRALTQGAGYAANKLGLINEPFQAQVPAANDAERGFITQNYSNDKLLSQVPDAQDKTYLAKQLGIDITPGEALNNDSMIAQQGTLSRKPGGVDAAQALRETRQKVQLPNALEAQIADISSVASPDEAGQGLIQGAQDLEAKVRGDLSKKAAPYYESAYAQSIPENHPVLDNSRVQDYLKTVRKDFPEYESLPDNSIQVLDEVKKLMDGDIGSALSGANPDRNAARLIGKSKSSLLNVMDNSSPAYAQARQIYAEGAPEIESLVNGKIGALANVKDVAAHKAPNQLLNGSVAQTQEVADKLPQQARDAAAGILQSESNNLRGENVATIQKRVFNTPKQQEQFQAMLGDKYQPFSQLMDIMERVNKGQNAMQGSPTAPLQEQSAKMDETMNLGRQAVSDKAGLAKSVVTKLFGMTPEAKTAAENKQYADLGNILLTPKGLDLLQTISELKPTIEQARKLLGLAQTTTTAGASTYGVKKFGNVLDVRAKK